MRCFNTILKLITGLLILACSNNYSDSGKLCIVPLHNDTLYGTILEEYVRSKSSKFIFSTPYGIVCATGSEKGVIYIHNK